MAGVFVIGPVAFGGLATVESIKRSIGTLPPSLFMVWKINNLNGQSYTGSSVIMPIC